MIRVGQNRIYTPYMTVYTVISLPKTTYLHRIYIIYGSGQPYRWCLWNDGYPAHGGQRSFHSIIIHRIGQNHTFIGRYIQCTYGVFSREITIHTGIYGADIQLWPTLIIQLNAHCVTTRHANRTNAYEAMAILYVGLAITIYIYTVFDEFPAKVPVYVVLANSTCTWWPKHGGQHDFLPYFYKLYCSETYHKIALVHVGRWLSCSYRLYCNTYHKIAVMHVERWMAAVLLLQIVLQRNIPQNRSNACGTMAVLFLQIVLQHIPQNRSNACGTMNGGCPDFTDSIATHTTKSQYCMWNDEWRLSCFYRLYCNTYHKIAVMHVERWLSCFYKLYCNTYHKIVVMHVERWMAAVLLLQIVLQHLTHTTKSQ